MNKNKYIKLTLIAAVVATSMFFTGCANVHEAYKNTGWWTPSSINFTEATDTKFKPEQHYFGASWDLK